MAHKAFTEALYLSRLTATVFASSHDCHPASALSFSTVRVQVVFGLPLLQFSSGAQVFCYVAVVVLVLSQYMSNHPPSTLRHLFTHRFHVCSF